MFNLGGCVLAINDGGVHQRGQSRWQGYDSFSDSSVGAVDMHCNG